MNGVYMGWGVGGGEVGSRRQAIPSIRTQALILWIGRDDSLAPHASLVMACSGSTGPVVHHCGLTKNPSVKPDLAIYNYVLGVSGCRSS